MDRIKSRNEQEEPILIMDEDELLDRMGEVFKNTIFYKNKTPGINPFAQEWSEEYRPKD